MKIIIYGLNFKPELIGVGKYTGELADYLNDKGHNVRVITAPKYYPDWKATNNKYFIDKNSDYKIFRCPIYIPKENNFFKRIIHLISFAISSLPALLIQIKWKPDFILLTAPTILCVPNIFIFKIFSFKKIYSMLHIQDFELETAFNIFFGKKFFIKELINKIEFLIFKNFDCIGTISNGMVQKLILKGISKEKIYYLPNWIDLNLIKEKTSKDKFLNKYRKDLKINSKKVIIQYSGSMGIKQGFKFLLPIIKYFKDNKNILWLFAGEGPFKKEFIYLTRKIPNIKFLPLQKLENLSDWLNAGDIHIIPQEKDIEDLVFPSKLLAILASGNPIVSNTILESDLGLIVEEVGKRVDPKDQIGFIKALDQLINSEKIRLKLGKKGRSIATKTFNKDFILKNFEEFITYNF